MSATNATLLYIGAKLYPKPPIDSAPNDFPFSAKRFFILSRTEKGVLQSLHPVPVSGKTIAKKGDGFARSHPLQVPEKISTVHSYATDFRLCLHTVQPSCDG